MGHDYLCDLNVNTHLSALRYVFRSYHVQFLDPVSSLLQVLSKFAGLAFLHKNIKTKKELEIMKWNVAAWL